MAGWIALLTLAPAAGCATMPVGTATAEFAGVVPKDLDGEILEDSQVGRLLARLDSLLNVPEARRNLRRRASRLLRGFRWWLEKGRVTAEQSRRISTYLAEAGAEHEEAAEVIDRQRQLFEMLTPGQVARNIVGTDTEGVDFELHEYRGNIVVLIFTGDWCGPCRGEYPYQRSMLDLYKDKDVVLLGVNSDSRLRTVRAAKEREGLSYRTWWDGGTDGPIATAWDVRAWPSTFILDAEGVIRFVDKRENEMILAVDRLLEEEQAGTGR